MASPDTSRPRANVRGLGASCIRFSSRSGRKPTTSLTWLGISMPTTSLPGIGASMRMERAARAMARSSARASMRDSLTWCSGLTSYWVTTGPVFVATTLAGIAKLPQLLLDAPDVARVVEARAAGADVGRGLEQRRRSGSVQSIALRRRARRSAISVGPARSPRARGRPRRRAGAGPTGAAGGRRRIDRSRRSG